MNYIELINNFWRKDEFWQFTGTDTRLYFLLLKIANTVGWEDTIEQTDSKMSALVGVSSNTFKTAQKRLVKAGLISVELGGKSYGNKSRYQILIPNSTPNSVAKSIPNSTPNSVAYSNKLNKEENTIPPLPSAGEKVVVEKTWRDDFQIYLKGLREAYKELLADKEFIAERERYHPGLNIKLSLEKACVEFWSLEAGWKHKKKSKSNDLDWKSTLTKALDQKSNKVWLQKGEENETDKQTKVTYI